MVGRRGVERTAAPVAQPIGVAASPEIACEDYRLCRGGLVPSMTKEQTMSALRTRMIEDMQLAGLSAKTQEVYLQAVTALVKHYGHRSPDQLTEEEVRCYLLAVRQRNARGTFKTCHYGIQFFYRNTLGKDWALFKKRSGSPSRSACRRRFPMPRSDAFWAASATRSTAAASA